MRSLAPQLVPAKLRWLPDNLLALQAVHCRPHLEHSPRTRPLLASYVHVSPSVPIHQPSNINMYLYCLHADNLGGLNLCDLLDLSAELCHDASHLRNALDLQTDCLRSRCIITVLTPSLAVVGSLAGCLLKYKNRVFSRSTCSSDIRASVAWCCSMISPSNLQLAYQFKM